MSATSSSSLKSIDVADLEQWYERDQRRKEHEREARNLKTANELLEEKIEAAMIEAQRDSIKRGDFRLDLVAGKTSIKWKEELIRIAGPDKAAEITKAAPPGRKHVEITKATA